MAIKIAFAAYIIKMVYVHDTHTHTHRDHIRISSDPYMQRSLSMQPVVAVANVGQWCDCQIEPRSDCPTVPLGKMSTGSLGFTSAGLGWL